MNELLIGSGRVLGRVWLGAVLAGAAVTGLPARGADRMVLCEEFTNPG
jgi:hypothetical protein